MQRGISGTFHFRFKSVSPEGERQHVLVGHWRTGVWDPEASLVLVRPDGHRVAIRKASLERSEGVAGDRGQARLTIEAERPEAVQGVGCVVVVQSAQVPVGRAAPAGGASVSGELSG